MYILSLVILSYRWVISKVQFFIMSIYIDFNTCETVFVDAFNEILILDMIFNDATTWHDSMYMYLLWVFNMMIYTWGFYRGFTGFYSGCLLWWLCSYKAPMNGPMERPYMGLIDIMMCPRCGWCGCHFNHDGFWGVVGMPRYHRVAYPGQHQWAGLVCYIRWFYYIKFISNVLWVYVLWYRILVVSGVILARRFQEKFRPAWIVFKKKKS